MNIDKAKKELVKLENGMEKLCQKYTEKTKLEISDFNISSVIEVGGPISYIIKVEVKL